MAKKLFALLVGIDDYPPPVPKLGGCANDIEAVEQFLRQRVGGDYALQMPRKLLDKEARRQAVIAGFREYLGQAGPGDVALFYYSGHGSQEVADARFWKLEPDRRNETLVCHDSRTSGGYDLADKELALLIAEVAAREAEVVVVLDCCHSGSGTRAALEDGLRVRRAPLDVRTRPLGTYLEGVLEVGKPGEADWLGFSQKHLLLAACHASETAKEVRHQGKDRGAFSVALLKALEGGSLTYRDLIKRVGAELSQTVRQQTPQLEAPTQALDRRFLSEAVQPRPLYYTLSHDRNLGWVMDAGAVHGIAEGSGSERTLLAIFPAGSGPAEWRSLERALGEVTVVEVWPERSRLEVGKARLDPKLTYPAQVIATPLPPLAVAFEGERAWLEAVRKVLATLGPGRKASLLVAEAGAKQEPSLRLLAREGSYTLTRPRSERPLIRPLPFSEADAARKMAERLEHVARWQATAALANPGLGLEGAIQVEFYRSLSGPTTRKPGSERYEKVKGNELRLEYRLEGEKWFQPAFKLRFKNVSQQTLYVGVLVLTESFEVAVPLEEGGGVLRLEPGQELWYNRGQPVYTRVPKEWWEAGVTRTEDLIKLIVSDRPFDATLLAQPALDSPYDRAATVTRSSRNSLERLMQRVGTRHIGLEPEGEADLSDWAALTLSITTLRPRPKADIGREGAELGNGVRVRPHPALQAKARLISQPQATRGGANLPPYLPDLEGVEPFNLTPAQGCDAGLGGLELSEVNDPKAVSRQQPLELEFDLPLSERDRLLAVAYDPRQKLWLPLGFGGPLRARGGVAGSYLRLERLPNPTPAPLAGERGLFDSIRLMLYKLVGQKLGLPFDYPRLSAITVPQMGKVQYEPDAAKVKAKVARAKKVLLYVHGILGHTKDLAYSACGKVRLGEGEVSLQDDYDLLLAFDYENIHTSIKDNGRLLRQKLEEAGFGPDDGKTLHILAHSMGGLVSRWMIEQEGGKAFVDHLIVMGTPSGGSPWASVQQLASTTLALGLNGAAALAWPLHVVGGLLGAIETVDNTLDELQPGSELLQTLARSPDPQVPYTVIAGTASIKRGSSAKSLVRRIFDNFPNAIRLVTPLVFLGQPNDLAASVSSVHNVNQERTPRPTLLTVGSDHFSYLEPAIGLLEVIKAVR